VLELEEGQLVERAVVESGESVTLSRPYDVTIRM